MMHLDVESLRTFLAVLDHGGMTSAAHHLGLSQSAVSWKMKRFEARVGRPLLIRDGHEFRPTREGRVLVEDARTIVELHDRAASRLATSGLTGRVRLGSNEEVDPAAMAELIGGFRSRHPGAEVEFRIDYTEQLNIAIDAGDLDVALLQALDGDLRPDDVVLWTDRLRWMTSAEHAHDSGPVPLVTFGDHCFYRTVSEPLLDEAGIDHRQVFSASSIGGIGAAIAAGLGVGVIGERHLDEGLAVWAPGEQLPELPVIHQVARTVPGESRDTVSLLIESLASDLVVAG